jgi:hypothetical protein
MSWLDEFAHSGKQDVDRLARAGVLNADDLLNRLGSHADLVVLSRETGIQEQRLLGFAVQAHFRRLRGAPVGQRG